MSHLLARLRETLRSRPCAAFHRHQDGSASIEAILMLPMLLFTLLFFLTVFDGFSAKTRANRANYTVSDYLARQTETVDPDFLDGLAAMFRFLSDDAAVSLRTSAVQYTVDWQGNGSYKLSWSYATGDMEALTAQTLPDVTERLPIMVNGEEILLVETLRPWRPVFDVGLTDFVFEDAVITKPRFAAQVPFDDGQPPGGGNSDDDTTDDPNMDHGGSRHPWRNH
nr:hypothetical protein [uncultured Celeribacter sp.]